MDRISGLLKLAFVAVLLASASAHARYDGVYFFGDSLTDTGNNAYLIDHTLGQLTSATLRTPLPVPSPQFVAALPYATDRYTNGPVWAEYFAARLGLGAQSMFTGGTNFAFGGASMGPAGAGIPPSVRDQVNFYLGTADGRASPTALYVIAAGGNDARQAATLALQGVDPSTLISSYVSESVGAIQQLEAAGAHDILFWSVPDIGVTPEFRLMGPVAATIGSTVSLAMVQAMAGAMSGLSVSEQNRIHPFNLYASMDRLVTNPAAYGLTDVTSTCAYSPACIADPGATLFWDALHPTTVGHALLATAAFASVNPEPEVYTLFAVGLIGMAAYRRAGRAARVRAS